MPDHVCEGSLSSALTGQVVKAAGAVHQGLGAVFEEVIYRHAPVIEFATCGLQFSREVWIDVRYTGENVGRRRVDFIVGDDTGDVLVATKAKAALEVLDFVHTLSHLKASGQQVALYLNFGAKRLGIKRIAYCEARRHNR